MTKRSLLYILFFCLSIATRGQIKSDIELSEVLPTPVQTQSFQYWFDSETDNIHEVSGLSGTYTLDVSSLTDGVHTLYYQAIGNDGKNYGLASAVFIKTMKGISELSGNMTIPATQLQYWFDSNTGNINIADASSGVFILDVSSLSDGIHTLSYRLVGVDDGVYSQASAVFLKEMKSLEKLSNKAAIAATKLHYWFDSDTENIQVVSGLSGAYTLDVSSLAEGVHTIHYQVIGIDGTGYDEASKVFVKMPNVLVESTPPAVNGMKYWFDQNMASAVNISAVNGTQMIDVSALPDGVHTLYYQLTYADGNQSPAIAGIFFKDVKSTTPEEDNAITKYQYWLNGNSTWIKTVDITNVSNPYTLYALLPLTKAPVRSSSFHFEVRNNEPAIYAKNDLFVRFHDARGYFVDDKKPFIDYNVKQMVEPVGEIQQIETFDRIEENTIRWYTVCVEAGDTVAFKLSQPATLQLFSPSGEEVYAANGVDATTWNGVHTWDSGTYYLAVHDVTGNRSTMTLEYMHMDKYDVVESDVHAVGNGGCSTITFKGNGFRDLYAVELYTVEGDSIHSIDVSHDSDAETAVTFDFMDAELGIYDAVFHFAEEDKIIAATVTVEEAIDIELATNVVFPSTFFFGSTTQYTVKISNKGNMTAYNMPLYVLCKDPMNAINGNIDIRGLKSKPISLNIDCDSLSAEDCDSLRFLMEILSQDMYFMKTRIYDETFADSIDLRTALFFVEIPPYSEKSITFTIQANAQVIFRTMSPKAMDPLIATIDNNGKYKVRHKSIKETYCCWRDQIECVLSIASDVASLADFITAFDPSCTTNSIASISSCLIGSFNQIVQSLDNSVCGAADHGMPVMYEDMKKVGNGISLIGTLTTCLSSVLPWNKVKKILQGISAGTDIMGGGMSALTTITDCMVALAEIFDNPKCPSSPDIRGGSSTPINSHEPNEIYGYLSDSGSRAIKEGVTEVFYTIQFENDSIFATAPAHDIYLTDTLDVALFDLSTYTPTSIKIGSKESELSGDRNFISTMDMRPEINAIAQIHGTIDDATGVVRWHISSLDPMTMEPVEDPWVGVLPVNFDGSGIGEASFNVSLKEGLPDGTEIPNRSGNVFDSNETVLTPTWMNIVDAVAPTSTILGSIQRTDSTLTLRLAGEDERSGVWKYNVYAQMGDGASWELVAENTTDTLVDVRIYDGIEYGFLVLATDSAGNVERKSFEEADFQLTTVTPGDANGDGTVDALDVVLVTSYYLGNNVYLNLAAADVNADGEVNSLDVVAIQNIYLNATNGKVLAPRRRLRKGMQ